MSGTNKEKKLTCSSECKSFRSMSVAFSFNVLTATVVTPSLPAIEKRKTKDLKFKKIKHIEIKVKQQKHCMSMSIELKSIFMCTSRILRYCTSGLLKYYPILYGSNREMCKQTMYFRLIQFVRFHWMLPFFFSWNPSTSWVQFNFNWHLRMATLWHPIHS